jgi:Skp family chaperone for outer membrane proteins
MKLDLRVAAAIAVTLVAALALRAGAQDKPAAGPTGRTAVLNVRECMDALRNQGMAEINEEIVKMQQADSGRATDLNPQERNRIRTKILDHYNKRRLEVYTAVVRLAGTVAKEKGFDLVQRADLMPAPVSGDPELMTQIYSRDLVYFDPGIDITSEVLDRINKEHAARKK